MKAQNLPCALDESDKGWKLTRPESRANHVVTSPTRRICSNASIYGGGSGPGARHDEGLIRCSHQARCTGFALAVKALLGSKLQRVSDRDTRGTRKAEWLQLPALTCPVRPGKGECLLRMPLGFPWTLSAALRFKGPVAFSFC